MNPINPLTRNESIVRALQTIGWSPERHLNAAEWVSALKTEGFTVFPLVEEILASIGGLHVHPVPSPDAVFGSGEFYVDPIWAASGESDRIALRQQQLEVKLCPLGEWLNEYVVLIADDGRVFAETSFQLLLLGSDIGYALETMILCEHHPEVINCK